jgi:hypothetical protein
MIHLLAAVVQGLVLRDPHTVGRIVAVLRTRDPLARVAAATALNVRAAVRVLSRRLADPPELDEALELLVRDGLVNRVGGLLGASRARPSARNN